MKNSVVIPQKIKSRTPSCPDNLDITLVYEKNRQAWE